MAQYDLFQNPTNRPSIDIDAYLERIQCMREYRPTLRFLRNLHRNHLYHIPFENLDIHINNQIVLDVELIYDKIINRNRGGFCYELNGLFFHLLLELGFEAKIVSARVYDDNHQLGKEFDHMMIVVYIDDEQWLADVGFGDSFLSPIRFETDKIQMDANKYYRLVENRDNSYTLQSSNDSYEFNDLLVFSKKEHQFIEFIAMCQYHQTSPKSHFTQKKLITQANKEGRITLSDKKLIITKMGERTETPVLNNDEFLVKLKEYFGVVLKKNR